MWGSNGITRCWINPQIVLYLYGYRIYNIYNIIYIYIYVCVCVGLIVSYTFLSSLVVHTTLEVTSPHLALVFAELPSSQLQLWRQHKDLLDPRAMSLPPGPRRCRFPAERANFIGVFFMTQLTQWIHNGLRKIRTRLFFSCKNWPSCHSRHCRRHFRRRPDQVGVH